jgi:hypothetical protein
MDLEKSETMNCDHPNLLEFSVDAMALFVILEG